SGTFYSRVFDALGPVNWATITWAKTTPPGTGVAISVRTGNSAVPDASWTDFAPIAAPGGFIATSRYVQYKADLTTSDASITPSLDDTTITTDHAPVAVNDTAATLISTSHLFPASGPNSLKVNDTDSDNMSSQLRVETVTPPSHGIVTINGDLSVTYTPTPG